VLASPEAVRYSQRDNAGQALATFNEDVAKVLHPRALFFSFFPRCVHRVLGDDRFIGCGVVMA